MDIGRLLTRTWEIVWNHKFLIILGVIIVVTSGGAGGGSGYNFNQGDFQNWGEEDSTQGGELSSWEDIFEGSDLPLSELTPALSMIAVIGVALLCVGVIIGLVLAYISRVATGGLIAGVDQIEKLGISSFRQAWGAGWEKGVHLFLIGLIASIPGLLAAFIIAALVVSFIMTNPSVDNMESLLSANIGLIITIASLICLGGIASLVLSALRAFADRACMIEDRTVFDAYRRGWEVLSANLGSAIVLFLIQIGIQIALGLLLAIPSFIIGLCIFLWPILWVISGAIKTYFSSLWTLAWREWTTGSEPAPLQIPAV